MSTDTQVTGETVTTDVPARMDRLPWGDWHWKVGDRPWGSPGSSTAWRSRWSGRSAGVLGHRDTLHFTEGQIGLLGTAYLVGAVLGALFFGYLTDRLGRKEAVHGHARCLPDRGVLHGVLVGLLELRDLPVLHRGGDRRRVLGDQLGDRRADPGEGPGPLSTWRSTAATGSARRRGSLSTLVLLDPNILPVNLGWRLGFGIGALLGLIIIFYRNHVPEKPPMAGHARPRRRGARGRRGDRAATSPMRGSRSSPSTRRSPSTPATTSASA